MAKVAVVTGGNRGLGFETVKQLAEQFDGTIYLTARNETQGNEAVDKLQQAGGRATIKFHFLDVTDRKTIENFKVFLQKNHGGIDILVNNAGVYVAGNEGLIYPKAVSIEAANTTIGVNYYGVKNVTETLLPLLKPHSRIVVVASRGGNLKEIVDESLRKMLLSPDLTVQQIDNLVTDYLRYVKEGNYEEKGFPHPYNLSKVAIIAYTMVLQRQFQKDPKKDIVANACCPGYVATDMTARERTEMNLNVGDILFGHFPLKNIEDGADTIVYLALLPNAVEQPRGKFVGERNILIWEEEKSLAELMAEQTPNKVDLEKLA